MRFGTGTGIGIGPGPGLKLGLGLGLGRCAPQAFGWPQTIHVLIVVIIIDIVSSIDEKNRMYYEQGKLSSRGGWRNKVSLSTTPGFGRCVMVH